MSAYARSPRMPPSATSAASTCSPGIDFTGNLHNAAIAPTVSLITFSPAPDSSSPAPDSLPIVAAPVTIGKTGRRLLLPGGGVVLVGPGDDALLPELGHARVVVAEPGEDLSRLLADARRRAVDAPGRVREVDRVAELSHVSHDGVFVVGHEPEALVVGVEQREVAALRVDGDLVRHTGIVELVAPAHGRARAEPHLELRFGRRPVE